MAKALTMLKAGHYVAYLCFRKITSCYLGNELYGGYDGKMKANKPLQLQARDNIDLAQCLASSKYSINVSCHYYNVVLHIMICVGYIVGKTTCVYFWCQDNNDNLGNNNNNNNNRTR